MTLYKLIVKKFLLASIIPILIVELSLVGTLFLLNRYQAIENRKELNAITNTMFTEILDKTANNLSITMQRARDDIRAIRTQTQYMLELYSAMRQNDLNITYSNGFFRNDIAGLSTLYTTNVHTLDAHGEQMLRNLDATLPLMQATLENHGDMVHSIWTNIRQYYAAYYPPIDVNKELTSDLDVTQYPFYFKADPAHNPKKLVIFFENYRESWALALGEMGSFVAPIYVNETFLGVTGLNLTVETLAKKIQSIDLPFDSYAMLVDKDNYLLVSSDANQSWRDFNKASFFALHQAGKPVSDSLAKHIMLTFTPNDAMIVKRTAIAGTNLSIVICASKAKVLQNVNRVFERSKKVGYWALGLIALFYAIFFIFRFVDIRQLADSLAQKLQQVIHFSNQLGVSDHAMPTQSNIVEFTLLHENLNAVHAKLQHLLIEDPLTQLPNRRKLINDLQERNVTALLLCDINQFQYINDVYGTLAGDTVLRTVASRLDASKQLFDGCYRLEPDIFAVTFLNTEPDETKLMTFMKSLQQPVSFEAEQIVFGMTSGLAVDALKEKLYSHAFIALAEAKQSDRGGIVTYSAELAMNQAYEKNLLWSHKSRLALQESRILPYFQPILDLKSGRINKFEALIRMREGDKIISPFFFLEPAKRTGILKELTKSMIAQVFDEAVKYPDIEFSINVSFTDLLDEYNGLNI